MKTDSEKEKKLSFALNRLKSLNLQNPSLKSNLENLNIQKNQLEIEKKQIEEKYQNLESEYKALNQKLEDINKQKIDEQKKETEFSEKIDKSEVRNAISERCVNDEGNNIAPEVKTVDNAFTLEITTKFLENSVMKNKEKVARIDASLASAFSDLGYSDSEFSNEGNTYTLLTSRGVESQISDELIKGSFLAVLFSLFIIFIYIAYRFRKWQFGLGALIAMFHDVLVVLGLFSIFYNIVPFSMEIDQAFIAAILTVIGYSLNDTVVVFDRIREIIAEKGWKSGENTNLALNSTLSRTLNTSLTTLVVLLSIFIFGGESLRGFMFAMIIGVLVGTYSSLFIATPIMYDTAKKGDAAESLKKKVKEMEELTLGSLSRAVFNGDMDTGSIMAGQSAGLVKGIRSCKEILEHIYEGSLVSKGVI